MFPIFYVLLQLKPFSKFWINHKRLADAFFGIFLFAFFYVSAGDIIVKVFIIRGDGNGLPVGGDSLVYIA